MRGEPASGATGPREQAARTARALFCVAPSELPRFELRQIATRRIPHGHMLERGLLTLKRAGGLSEHGFVKNTTPKTAVPESPNPLRGTAVFFGSDSPRRPLMARLGAYHPPRDLALEAGLTH